MVKVLVMAVYFLISFTIILIIYIVVLQLQLRNINRQLDKRMTENTRQPVSLELFNKELNTLSANINKCLKAEETLRLKSIREEKKFKELVANISHDLRTPLTVLKGYQQLLEKGELSKEQRKKLDTAQKYADELGVLIESFFEYTYLINAEPEMNITKINLTDLVTECLVESITSFEERNLAVRFEDTPIVFVQTDRKMVLRIVQNLIRNCISYADGDIGVQVLKRQNAAIIFRNPVKNASEIDVDRLFDRFYTADKSRSNTTGLGLAIVKLLAKRLGGSANVSIQSGYFEIIVELPQ